MLVSMSKHPHLQLTAEERAHLDALIRSGTSLARTQTKARILLLTDRTDGHARTDADIAAALHVTRATIIRTRQRCAVDGLDAALYDKPRLGATPKITGAVETQLTVLACSTPPNGKGR